MKKLILISLLCAALSAAAYGQVPLSGSTINATVSLTAPTVATSYTQVQGQPSSYGGAEGYTSYGKNGTGDFDFVAANSGSSPSFYWYFLLGTTPTVELFLDQNANFHVPGGSLTAGGVISTSSVNPHTYTFATLPGASVVGIGGMVVISDAASAAVGACAGGGSTYMIAVSNGTSWSCH